MPVSSIIYTTFLCIIFGANVTAAKISLSAMGPLTVVALRFLMAACAITLWAWITHRPFHVPAGQRVLICIQCILFVVQLGLMYVGLSKTHATRAVLIMNLQPFFVLILAHFFIAADRMNLHKVVSMLLGFSGVMLVFLDKSATAAALTIGDFMVLTATFLWSVSAVYIKRIIDGFTTFHLVYYPILCCVPVFFIGGFFLDPLMFGDIRKIHVFAMLYQGFFVAGYGFVAWTGLVKRYGAVALHSFLFIVPIVGVISSGWLLNEPITHKIIAAMVLISSGVLTLHIKPVKVLYRMGIWR